MFLKTF